MTKTKMSLALVLALGLVAPMASAQETTPAAPAAPAAAAPAAAPAADGPGSTYLAASVEDWQVQCLRTEDGKDPCEMFQLLKDSAGNKVASMSVMALPKASEAAAGVTITTPLESQLSAGVTLKIDDKNAVTVPYSFCTKAGCFANVAMKEADIDRLKKGNKIAVTVVPVAAPDQKVELTVSLKGFTAAFEAASKNVAK